MLLFISYYMFLFISYYLLVITCFCLLVIIFCSIVNTSCTLGCSGLTFCKNFNNRLKIKLIYFTIHPSICLSIHPSIHSFIHPSIHPFIYLYRPLTLFRQCKPLSDTAAKLDYTAWKNLQTIYHPLITIYTLDLESCYPDWWKAAACVSQIQPCQPNTHTALLCK